MSATPEAQTKAAYTHDCEIGRLKYTIFEPGATTPVSEQCAVKALLRKTRHVRLWRLANQELFFDLTEVLFRQLQEDWPNGDVSVANVDEQAGAGGSFELWLPSTCCTCPDSDERLDQPAAAIDGGVLTATCIFSFATQARTRPPPPPEGWDAFGPGLAQVYAAGLCCRAKIEVRSGVGVGALGLGLRLGCGWD